MVSHLLLSLSNHPLISCLISCDGNSVIRPFPSSSAFTEPFAKVEVPYWFIGAIAFASLPSLLLARMIPNTRKPTRQETATTAAMTMPAMAPEDRPEGDLEALGLLDGLDIDTGEVVVASALDQQMGARIWVKEIL